MGDGEQRNRDCRTCHATPTRPERLQWPAWRFVAKPGVFGQVRVAGTTMQWGLLVLMAVVGWVLAAAPVAGQEHERLARIMRRYAGMDLDSDGIAEVNRMNPLKFRDEGPDKVNADSELVLVLVEERLLSEIPDSKWGEDDLLARLEQYETDLQAEGYAVQTIRCDLYAGPEHQDGLTLLALRRFLTDVAKQAKLKGVVLVGSFPEAMLVRRWLWRRENWDVTIAGKAYRGADQKDFLRIVPEVVAPRADIVLADLDGNWESIYVRKPMKLESIEALPDEKITEWPKEGMVFESSLFNDTSATLEDFFWIQEDDCKRLEAADGKLRLKIRLAQRHPEVSRRDRTSPNPMAVPDILVSRINARHVAVTPDRGFRDRNGRAMLNENGKPQVVETVAKINPAALMRRDPAFERKLLVDYFDRNHAYRTNVVADANRTAALSHGHGLISAEALNSYLQKASPSFGDPVSFPDGSLLDYVHFLKTAARLKGLSAHSNPWNSGYGGSYSAAELESQCGGTPWRWKEDPVEGGFCYTPSFAAQGGAADSYIHRTIYENGLLDLAGGSLYIHNGCEVNTPEGATSVPYSDDRYGSSGGFQNAESILFFLNGVALASRAKTFYDTPRGFTEKMGEGPGHCFGEGWRAYFQLESGDAALADNVAGNKRTYPWSIIGDWTLTAGVK